MKNYVAISRDHSGSMSGIGSTAMRDYNAQIDTFKSAAVKHNIDTAVTVIKCGTSPVRGGETRNILETMNQDIKNIPALQLYDTNGAHTPLFDSIGSLIDTMTLMPDFNDPDVSFLIIAITDGGDNSSRLWSASKLGQKINELQRTDRWTFAFRVPRGYSQALIQMGIPAGNIQEWDQTQKGLEQATAQTTASVNNYYAARSAGLKSTDKFFTNLAGVSAATIKANLVDVSNKVEFWTVKNEKEGFALREFCESKLGKKKMLKGAAFYQLTKSEPKVQDYKQIAIRDKTTKHVYTGVAARNILGLPHNGDIKLAPGAHGKYDIFIQSTSVNRKLPVGTQVMYYEEIGEPYKNASR